MASNHTIICASTGRFLVLYGLTRSPDVVSRYNSPLLPAIKHGNGQAKTHHILEKETLTNSVSRNDRPEVDRI